MFIICLTGEMGVLGVCSVAQPCHKNPDSFHPFSLLFSTFLLMFIATWSQDSCHSIKYHILTLNVIKQKHMAGAKVFNFVVDVVCFHRKEAPCSNSSGFPLGFINQNWSTWPFPSPNKLLMIDKITWIGLRRWEQSLFSEVKGSPCKKKVELWLLGNKYPLCCLPQAIYKTFLHSKYFYQSHLRSYSLG